MNPAKTETSPPPLADPSGIDPRALGTWARSGGDGERPYEYLFHHRRERWLLVATSIACDFVAAAYLPSRARSYSADVLLQVEDKTEKHRRLDDVSSVFSDKAPADTRSKSSTRGCSRVRSSTS